MNRKFCIFAITAVMSILLTACGQSGTASAAGTASGSTSGSTASQAGKNSDGYTVIDAAAAKAMMDKGGVLVVDVRTAAEYADAHIPDAVNIPNESIGSEKPAGLPDTEAVILVYCRTGIRAADASAKLAKMGYSNIYDMGGITTWPYETVKG
jgi:rhodanese-related sulfurtransferase